MNELNNKFSILYISDKEEETPKQNDIDISIKIDLLESQLEDLKSLIKSFSYLTNNKYRKLINRQIYKIENNIELLYRYYIIKDKSMFYTSKEYKHFCCEIYH